MLCNPRLPDADRSGLLTELLNAPVAPGHVWLATSGSSGQIKWVALSKQALLASAHAVNAFLDSHSKDVWFNPLPPFHVGGLGIWARSHLSGAQVVDFYGLQQGTWDARLYHALAHQHQATLSSLVPAQVYDLVHLNLCPPASLRAIIVGGGALSESLLNKGRELGWKLHPSYGLTECASQVATWRQDGLEILNHVEIRISKKGCIEIHSPALLSLYALTTSQGMQYIDPKVAGWFTTEDQGALQGQHLQILGRQGSFIKIGGESVDLSRLERILEEAQTERNARLDLALVAFPDARLGFVIHLAAAAPIHEVQPVIDLYHSRVLPFEKIRKIHFLDCIPRSPLHKVLKNELLERLSHAH